MSCDHRWDWWPDTPQVRALGLGVAALRYAELGYAVAPLVRGGKKPHRMLPERGGIHHATTDPGQIMAWWRQDKAANIGVATGKVSALCVIDLDVKNPQANGPSQMIMHLAANNVSIRDDVATVITPSGGRHLWLRVPDDWPVPERPGILPGVDVKGTGGLIVAPPSMRPVVAAGLDTERSEPVAVPYEWKQGCPCSLGLMPPWMVPWLATAPVAPVWRDDASMSQGEDIDEEEAARHGFEVGQRNRELYRLACSLYRRYGTTPQGAEAVLRRIEVVWDAGDRTGMPRREVLVIVESARRFIERQQERERAMLMGSQPWLDRHGT